MKLDRFATQKNANEGVWVEPILFGEKIGVEFLVIGKDSDEVQKYTKAMAKEIAALPKDERAEVDWKERSKQGTGLRIKGMRAVGGGDGTLGGEKIEATQAGYVKLFNEIPELQDFIYNYTEDRANFLSKEKKSSNGQ